MARRLAERGVGMTASRQNRAWFEGYGHLARSDISDTAVAGRYPSQARAERLIPAEIAAKLDLGPTDTLLDVGCGPGRALIPLSYMVREAVGIDHPDVIARLAAHVRLPNVKLIGANFLDIEIESRFSRVLVYGVIQLLSDEAEVVDLVERAFALLEPGGSLLVGDIANGDQRGRFLNSAFGRAFSAEWQARRLAETPSDEAKHQTLPPPPLPGVQIDDGLLLRLLARFRRADAHAWILPEPAELPFGHTREDILIRRL